MSTTKKVSVIMNCFNCSKYLHEAIDSIYAQTYKDWEIIFWDNASTDNSAEIARSYDNKLRYFCSESTLPLGNARNLAIEQARGEYVAFLDCDDAWLPEKLEKQLELFDAKSEVMLVYSDSYIIDENGNIIKAAFDTIKPVRGHVFNKLFCYHNFITLPTAVIKKKVLDEVGLFNPSYKMSEEYDLFLKIAYSHPVDYIEQPLAKYRVHSNNFSKNLDIGIREELEIIDRWLRKDPDLKKEFGNKIRIRKTRRLAALYLFYLVKYVHLPKRLAKFY